MDTTSSATLSSVLDELDRAIAENLNGLTAGQCDENSSEASVYELRGLLQRQFIQDGDMDLDQIQVDFSRIFLPAWIPKSLSDMVGLTGSMTASQALASALQNPGGHDPKTLVSAIAMASRVSEHSGSNNNSRSVSECAGPSGLTTADRRGALDRPSGPSSTTSSTTTLCIEQPVSHNTNPVSPTSITQQYRIGTASRASGSSRAVARAQLELELARAKEERIQRELDAINVASSRCSEDDSLADRLSLAGLGGSRQMQATAPSREGAAHSPRHGGAEEAYAADQLQKSARQDQPAAMQQPEHSPILPQKA